MKSIYPPEVQDQFLNATEKEKESALQSWIAGDNVPIWAYNSIPLRIRKNVLGGQIAVEATTGGFEPLHVIKDKLAQCLPIKIGGVIIPSNLLADL